MPAFTIATVIGLLGAIQGVVLAGAIGSLGGAQRKPNRVLALLLLIFSGIVATVILEHARVVSFGIGLILLEHTLSFLFPPILWQYSHIVLGLRSRVPITIHMLPAILWVGYLGAFTLGWLGKGADAWRWLPPILGLMIYLMSYTIAVALKTWRARTQALLSHGLVLRVLVATLMVLHVAQLIRYVFREISALDDIVPLTGTAIIYVVSILAFRQSRLFVGREPASVRKKYEASTLASEQAEEIQHRLLHMMEHEKPYLNENVNLSELATRLAVPRAHLSQVINANLESTVPQLLNEHRVAEALRLLGDPAYAHLTLEAIGYEVGFRSRSGFYGAFKRITGETPAQARVRLS